MSSEPVLYLIAAAVGLSALALIAQAIALLLISRSVRQIKDRVDELAPKAHDFLTSAEKSLLETRQQLNGLSSKANEILDSTKSQVQRTDEFLSEATGRAKLQLDRVELVLDDTISRVHETVMVLNKGILRPLREINGVTAGIRTAIEYVLRGGRPDVSRATTDEEMFI